MELSMFPAILWTNRPSRATGIKKHIWVSRCVEYESCHVSPPMGKRPAVNHTVLEIHIISPYFSIRIFVM